MSEVMTCMPFEQLMNWVLEEKKTKGTVFGQHRAYVAEADKKLNIFERNLETPIGPAAGPHTQLTQNIVASYYAGARFFELKTVQKMDGAELAACINRPCILAEDEGYNCEWSTELYVPQAMGEYIKAWFILHVIAKEFDLGAQDGFQFNISVGYDLEGIKTPKIDGFINNMMEAKDTEIFLRYKTTFNNTELKQISNPFGIFIVVFLAFNSAYPFRVGNDDIGNMGFQYIVDRNIVLTSGFHAYILTVVLNQPVSKAD